MTDIDLKRLAVDREYWPKEAEAFFYMPEGVFKPFFAKYANHSDFSVEGMSGGWIGEKLDGESYHVFSECWEMIPRPTKKAQEVGWDGESWPIPIGAVFENSFGEERTVVAHDQGLIVCRCGGEMYRAYDGSYLPKFRPLRTKQQSQREELADLLEPYCRGSYCGNEKAVADAILSKYNLEPKP